MESTMTVAHILYIPAVLLFGLAVGWVLGGRAVRQEIERSRARDEARAQRRAERAARRAERAEQAQRAERLPGRRSGPEAAPVEPSGPESAAGDGRSGP